ncbi:MAG: L-threonylcarbamoyladenylate synthase [Parcubacteria group bacterium]|jgi:L-threonylcarbamoyladenylate synthase
MEVNKIIVDKIKKEAIGVIPTDTIYGVVASALSKKAVARAYKILSRNPKKPFIILISSIKDLELFGVILDNDAKRILKKLWPGKVSVILPSPGNNFRYLHRGTKSLAFRLPRKKSLTELLGKTGPLISTSANPEGKKPAVTVAGAKKYFDNKVDFFVNAGKLSSKSSTLLKVEGGKICIIRRGTFQTPENLLQ